MVIVGYILFSNLGLFVNTSWWEFMQQVSKKKKGSFVFNYSVFIVF